MEVTKKDSEATLLYYTRGYKVHNKLQNKYRTTNMFLIYEPAGRECQITFESGSRGKVTESSTAKGSSSGDYECADGRE